MSARLAVLLLATLLTRTDIPPALAQSPAPETRERAEELAREAEQLARESAEQIIRSLELLLKSIPQYDLPEITEDGDIIIRRRRPDELAPLPEDPTMDET